MRTSRGSNDGLRRAGTARLSRKLLAAPVAAAVLVAMTSGYAVAATVPAAVSAPAADMVMGGPTGPTDESKVPHYFGPYPNWANSPQVLVNAIVTIGDGGPNDATATATVDPATGAITAIDVTSPGAGLYPPNFVPPVVITAPGSLTATGATAHALVTTGVVTAITVAEAGFGFTQPRVVLTGGTATTSATATVSGGVDNVTLANGGSGYTIAPIVSFGLPDAAYCTAVPAPAVPCAEAKATATMAAGVVTGVEVTDPGSGYTRAPSVTIRDGIAVNPTAADATATIGVARIDISDGGSGYDTPPVVTIEDSVAPLDKGASATAAIAAKGAVTGVVVDTPGSGYLTPGLKKFVDTLPGLTEANKNNLGNYIPVAVPDTTTYPGSDYYEIGLVQYRHQFSSMLPAEGTLLRGYVQLSTDVVPGKHVQLTNANLDPMVGDTDIVGLFGVDTPHYLGPTIVATKDKPVRIKFRNLLPTGMDGDLFLPVDTSMMGSGAGPDAMMLGPDGVPMDMAENLGTVMDGVRNPMCGATPKPRECFSENRATLHLHGGITPWISDGTPHQWVTPAGEDTAYPAGVSVSNVPDMPDPGDGSETFFYTNQQSARLMFYHDHAWGITRLNVYAGEAAGYLITDPMEQSLLAPGGALDGLGTGTPLIVQDKTFVPSADQMMKVDPTWDTAKWGAEGSLWAPHVYMPAQNPGDPSGMSSFGRWMYGPWFWPPAKDAKYAPIDNPYYDPMCDPDIEPFCEPQLIPGTPNVSVGMEAFNDTPIVNGTAYPKTTVDPKTYRYRILNAANDRFWNLSWYVADPTTGTLSEVALKPAEVAAAQTDPVVFPTPDTTKSPKGPNWIQIGTEGGFLPAPVVVPAHETTWITDPTRFDVGNVDQHSLLLAPAERADVIVDFSAYRGKTLILYNDAPAAFPARVPGYDYYTGGPDLSPSGAPTTLPGYGPNTRTIMQVKVSNAAPALAFDRPNTTNDRMGALEAAFAHHLDVNGNPAGVFEAGQNPIVVGQAAYNATYGKSFAASGWCNAPSNPSPKCDGFARIAEQGGDDFTFDTLSGNQVTIPLEGKGIHDEMNSANFDEFGRMTANMGLEAPGATPLLQNIILYPYVNPVTEILDATGLPSSLDVTPISTGTDGTQIWKITHNGVDTHPIHFHLYDVQVINRVTWDNIIIPPEATELGWKDTVRVSPLEDTIVAVRPIVPTIPFGVPDSVRPLNPMMPLGAKGAQNGPNGTQAGFNNTDVNGNPIAPIVNALTNFGWEYVYHCHILSHEEMDMMRPEKVVVETAVPDAPVLSVSLPTLDLAWTDGTPVDYADPTTWGGPTSEVGYRIERADEASPGVPGDFAVIADGLANSVAYADVPPDPTAPYYYRVTAWNAAGDSPSNIVRIAGRPAAPTNLTAVVEPAPALASGSQVALGWTNNAVDATSVVIERAVGAGAFSVLATLTGAGEIAPGPQSFVDTAVNPGTYRYQVRAENVVGQSVPLGPVSVLVPQPGSTTTVLSSLNPSFVGDAVTFTATVAPVGASGTPTGSVTFTVNGTTSVVALDGAGVATITTSALPAGTHTITADYAGDTVFLPSSGTVDQVVDKRVSSLEVTSSLNPSAYGTAVTFTMTATPSAATGAVQLLVDGVALGSPVPLVAGSASVTTSTLDAGTYSVSATYAGDATYLPSTSPAITQVVNRAVTATAVTMLPTPSVFGQSVTMTARITPAGVGVLGGTVQFRLDGVAVGGARVVNASGVATYALSSMPVGLHSVTATFSGNGNYLPSTSAAVGHRVNRAATRTVLVSSRNPAPAWSTITFTATVTTRAPGAGIPTGTVQFRIGGRNIGAPIAVGPTGIARLTTSLLGVGTHQVMAIYRTSTSFNQSESTTINQRML